MQTRNIHWGMLLLGAVLVVAPVVWLVGEVTGFDPVRALSLLAALGRAGTLVLAFLLGVLLIATALERP